MFLFTTPTPSEPRPAASSSPVLDAIRTGSERSGTDFGYLLKTAQRESALDPAAKAPNSSASGLFQFIEQTWLGLVKATGADHGLGSLAQSIAEVKPGRYDVADPATKQKILDLRKDPQVAAVMAGEFTRRNAAQLQGALGRAPSGGELYAAHFMGSAGAADLARRVQSQPNAAAAELYPEQAASNRSIFYDKSGRAKSVAEVYATLVNGHEKLAVPDVPKLSSDPSSWLIGRDPGPAVALAYAHSDGPAMHSLFRTEGVRGPINQTVQRLWSGVPVRAEAEGPRFFPRTASLANPAVASDASPASPAASKLQGKPVDVPLPPVRPNDIAGAAPAVRQHAQRRTGQGTTARGPLDLASFAKPRG
jgi:hypothetical protein